MAATARKARARAVLSITQVAEIKRRLRGSINGVPTREGYVCSESWADHCVNAIITGIVPPRKKMRGVEGDMYRAGVYPPGGPDTAMVETPFMRYVPPDITGSGVGEREDAMSFAEGCKFDRSVSAIELDKIRLFKARPEKQYFKRKAKGNGHA